MKRMLHRAISILREERGETLFESVVSILVFTILAVAVSMVILVSMAVTASANNWSRIMQGAANAAVSGDTFIIQQSGGDRQIKVQDSVDIEIEFVAPFFVENAVPGEPGEFVDVTFVVPVTVFESEEQPELGTFTFVAFEHDSP